MKTNSRLFVLFFVVCFAGCVQVEQRLTLHADGSGVLEWSYGVRQDALEKAGATVSTEAVPFKGTEGLPDEESIRAGFRDLESMGLILESVKRETREGYIRWDIRVRFASLESLAKSPLMAGQTVSLLRDGQGDYIFQRSGGYPGSMDGLRSEDREAERQWMKGFHATLCVETPGRILEANATERAEKTATWVYDLEKDPDVLHKAGTAVMRVVFEGKDLALPCFATGI